MPRLYNANTLPIDYNCTKCGLNTYCQKCAQSLLEHSNPEIDSKFQYNDKNIYPAFFKYQPELLLKSPYTHKDFVKPPLFLEKPGRFRKIESKDDFLFSVDFADCVGFGFFQKKHRIESIGLIHSNSQHEFDPSYVDKVFYQTLKEILDEMPDTRAIYPIISLSIDHPIRGECKNLGDYLPENIDSYKSLKQWLDFYCKNSNKKPVPDDNYLIYWSHNPRDKENNYIDGSSLFIGGDGTFGTLLNNVRFPKKISVKDFVFDPNIPTTTRAFKNYIRFSIQALPIIQLNAKQQSILNFINNIIFTIKDDTNLAECKAAFHFLDYILVNSKLMHQFPDLANIIQKTAKMVADHKEDGSKLSIPSPLKQELIYLHTKLIIDTLQKATEQSDQKDIERNRNITMDIQTLLTTFSATVLTNLPNEAEYFELLKNLFQPYILTGPKTFFADPFIEALKICEIKENHVNQLTMKAEVN